MIFHNQYNMDTNQSEQMLAIALKWGLRDPLLCGLLPLVIGFWGVSGVPEQEAGWSV